MIIVYSYNFALTKLYKITNIMKRGLFMDKSFDVLILTQMIEKLCKENGVQLILWRYDETISKAALEKRIKQISED